MVKVNHTELVKLYNALPRQAMAPSGVVPNVWHFDLRYIPISPPSHMLFILQKESHFIGSQTLPLEKKVFESGLAYFPETAKEAALDICLGLMHSFITSFADHRITRLEPHGIQSGFEAFAPWKLTTDDRGLAKAVEEQFKSLGVHADRCKVEYANITRLAHQDFDDLYKGIKDMLGVSDLVKAALVTPTSIGFSNIVPPDPKAWSNPRFGSSAIDDGMGGANSILDYIHEFMNSEPLPVNEDGAAGSSSQFASRMHQSFGNTTVLLQTTTLKDIRKRADAGDAQQAVDAALRLRFGCGCTPNRVLSRNYLIKAAFNEKASSQTRSMAHSMLINWYILGREQLRPRYLFAAAYHADEAIRLASEGKTVCSASPSALYFRQKIMGPTSENPEFAELWYHFKWIAKAHKEREVYMNLKKQAAEKKMMSKPNRYRCANAGCGIQADTGKMLSQCSGKCDRDVKPSYCSKACQKADWKTHKPFCRPGAPCSVLDTSITTSGISQDGSFRVPVHHEDGTTTLLESSTVDPKMLKEMGDIMAGRSLNGKTSTLRTELFEI